MSTAIYQSVDPWTANTVWCDESLSFEGTVDWRIVRHINDSTGQATSQTHSALYQGETSSGYTYSNFQRNRTTWLANGDEVRRESQTLEIYAPDGALFFHAYTDKTTVYHPDWTYEEDLKRWDVGCD